MAGNGTLRPRSVSAILFGLNVPNFVDVSAKKYSKPLNRNVPAYIVRLLVFWYSHQQMFVKWGNVMSSVFTVSNGVRQGGVLSPYLFNVYMDGLSEMLNTCRTGCYSGVSKVNHLMYADDLVLMSPCKIGLSRLLKNAVMIMLSHMILYTMDLKVVC